MPTDTFEQTSELKLVEAGEGYVLYDNERDRVHFLNSTAAVIYELCEEGGCPEEIARELDTGFGLGSPPIEDVRTCLESLEAERLIRRR